MKIRPTTDVRLRRVLDHVRELGQGRVILPLVVGHSSQANLPEPWNRTFAIATALLPWLVTSGVIVTPPIV